MSDHPSARINTPAVTHSVLRCRNGAITAAEKDTLATEEPMDIRLRWQENGETREEPLTITMRTPGHDSELAIGLLFSEGIIRQLSQIDAMQTNGDDNTVTVALADGHQLDLKRYQRHFCSTSSCGVCGKMNIESLRLLHQPSLPVGEPRINPHTLQRMPAAMRTSQALFRDTGGVHAAALFDSNGTLLLLREDIGRHNAVDKLIGAALHRSDIDMQSCILLLSGRAGFEIVQKALVADIPCLAAIGAPTSLAVEMAQTYGMTLIGFLGEHGFNCYSGSERLTGNTSSLNDTIQA